MKRLSILFALVIAACGGDKAIDTKPIEIKLPTADAGVEPQAGFGSGVANDNKVVVENKATTELPPVQKWIPETYAERMKLGKEVAAKDHDHARALFEGAAKLDRKAAAPHVELARLHIAKGEKQLAIRAAKKAVKLAPESSQAYNTLGRAELLRHDYDGAELAFRQATELDPDNVWAWNNLGLVYLTQKNYQEAVNALVEATGRKGALAYMWNNLGTAYEQLDQLDDARDAFDSGAKLGSVAAKASRKRLDGVDTIKVAKRDAAAKDTGFTTREEMPEPEPEIEIEREPVTEDAEPEPAIDEHVEGTLEEPASGTEEPKADEPASGTEEPKVEEPKADEPKPGTT